MVEQVIIIVDDDEAVRDSLALLLNLRGFQTRTYASGASCLDDWQPDWRGCLLLDLRMVGMDGLALQRALNKRGSTLPVIFLTGHGNLSHARTALRDGALDFLTKPYSEEALLGAIKEALEQDRRQHVIQTRVNSVNTRLARLSTRERQVLDGVLAGRPNRTIAAELGISPRTVEVFKARMMEKMRARSVPELVRLCLADCHLEPPSQPMPNEQPRTGDK